MARTETMSIASLASLVWARRVFLAATVGVVAAISVIVSLLLPNKYLSSATVVAASNAATLQAGQFSQLTSLASLAGIDLRTQPVDLTTKYGALIQSRQFIVHFIKKRGILPQLFAGRKWIWQENRWQLDSEIYDEKTATWVRKVSYPRQTIPADWEAYERFLEVFKLEEDKKTALVTVSLKLRSPYHARLWLEWMIADFNEYVRARDIAQAQQVIGFLVKEAEKTEQFEVREVLGTLLEQSISKSVLANVQKDYALEVIDAPALPGKKYEPKRALIVLMSCFLAGLLGFVYVVVTDYR